ncbi:MAG: TetR/AcrR family transcriptional regulator [Acidobacteria bacterium]|nr:TetR/AcrR family transcriptional regulator [Candidatus Sulfomarinibacter kjeldsenii]
MASKSSIARERILDASSAVFAEEGFAGARVDAIAQRAGVNKAMLYYHIGDKRALYGEVLNRNFGRIEMALEEGLSSDGSAAERLRSVITIVESAIAANPDHARIVLREFASGSSNLPAEILHRMLGLLTVVKDILAEGSRTGEFRPTDPVMTHLTLIGAILMLNVVSPLRERVVDLGSTVDFPTADADIARFLGDLLLEGIATQRSGEPT